MGQPMWCPAALRPRPASDPPGMALLLRGWHWLLTGRERAVSAPVFAHDLNQWTMLDGIDLETVVGRTA